MPIADDDYRQLRQLVLQQLAAVRSGDSRASWAGAIHGDDPFRLLANVRQRGGRSVSHQELIEVLWRLQSQGLVCVDYAWNGPNGFIWLSTGPGERRRGAIDAARGGSPRSSEAMLERSSTMAGAETTSGCAHADSSLNGLS